MLGTERSYEGKFKCKCQNQTLPATLILCQVIYGYVGTRVVRERGTVCGAVWGYISRQEIKEKNTFQDVIQSNEETETSENMDVT